jgi:hypothetical protein
VQQTQHRERVGHVLEHVPHRHDVIRTLGEAGVLDRRRAHGDAERLARERREGRRRLDALGRVAARQRLLDERAARGADVEQPAALGMPRDELHPHLRVAPPFAQRTRIGVEVAARVVVAAARVDLVHDGTVLAMLERQAAAVAGEEGQRCQQARGPRRRIADSAGRGHRPAR